VPDFPKFIIILYILEDRKKNKVSWVVNPDRLCHYNFLLSSKASLTINIDKGQLDLLYLIHILGRFGFYTFKYRSVCDLLIL
jgi:hypothetical protein